MDFTYTEEQEELRALIRDFLHERSPESAVRTAMDSEGYDWALWKGLASEIGVPGLAIAEEAGGLGLGNVELGIVAEELGRSLACVPYFSTVVLGATALGCADDGPVRDELLASIAAGEAVVAVGVSDDGRDWDLERVRAHAQETGDGWAVTGVKDYVLDGHVADRILVVARAGDRPALFAVDPRHERATIQPRSMMDLTRRFATVTLEDVPAELVASDASALVATLLDTAIAVLAAEQVGGADRCIELSVEYAKMRVQFGRAIGTFQAIKHKCADMLIQVEGARAATSYALWCLDAEPESVPVAAAIARVTASQAFFRAAADTIQIHGGIGFTWEHPAHLYFKRAKSSELWLGDTAAHRERVGRLVGLTAEG